MGERNPRKLLQSEVDRIRDDTLDRCTATNANGEPCKKYPMKGATTCGSHTPRPAKKRAESNRVMDMAKKKSVLYNPDAPPVTDPVAELQMLAGQLKWMHDTLGEHVNALERLTTYSNEGVEQIKAVIGLWERTISQYNKILVDMTRLGIEERMTVMRERFGDAIIEAIRSTINDQSVQLTPAQQQALTMAAQEHFKLALGADRARAVIPGELTQ